MALANVEIVRGLYKAASEGRMDASLELLAPDVEFHLSNTSPNLADVYCGHEEVRQLNDRLNARSENILLLLDRLYDLGDRVLVLSQLHATGRGGIERLRFAHVWTLRDGKVVRMDAFSDQDAALEAVGLSA